MSKKFLTVREASELLGVSETRVRQLASTGRIKGAKKHGRDWSLPSEVEITPGTRGPGPKRKGED